MAGVQTWADIGLGNHDTQACHHISVEQEGAALGQESEVVDWVPAEDLVLRLELWESVWSAVEWTDHIAVAIEHDWLEPPAG